MSLRLLLTCSILCRASAVCFGPCLEGKVYEIRPSRSSIEVECSRHYNSRTSSKGCITTMSNTWNLASASVNEFADMERAYEEEGRAGAELACEKVCAATSACEAFGVSSDAHVAEGSWQCTIFYTCASTQFNEHLDLYQRNEPRACLAKATAFDGVFVNYIEANGGVSQTSRVLTIPSRPFLDVHVKVNGEFNETFNGFRPYKSLKEPFCDQYDSDCVILHAGGYSAVVVSIFSLIVAFNSCVLYVSLTKPNETVKREAPKLRRRVEPKTLVNSTLRTRSNRISF